MEVDTKQITALRKIVWAHYKKAGRHDLPWRQTSDPYRILVSEIMLQQTQVDRVVPKYQAFLKQFPTAALLAHAPLSDVLRVWQGLGYNRRAKALHSLAQELTVHHHGVVPETRALLVTLPGVGAYTAGAVCVFAYGQPGPLVETNIRTVLFHHLFGARAAVSDAELLELTTILCDEKRPREWYWALMDYGSHLKAEGVRTNPQSKHYTKQSTFKGSDREIRGIILKVLGTKRACTMQTLIRALPFTAVRVRAQLQALIREGLVAQHERKVALAGDH